MRVSFIESPEGMQPGEAGWCDLRDRLRHAKADVIVTNEMPFGFWLASSEQFDPVRAGESVSLHEEGIEALKLLDAPLVLSSRPVWANGKLANEAFALAAGQYRALHQKHFFPQEPGFFEETWFDVDQPGFEPARFGDLGIGVLLCTELMFNEQARAYGRANVDLIAVPRAAGTSHQRWMVAGAMAAIVSGSYVVSANRSGHSQGSPNFGGFGFAFSPTGELISQTSSADPVMTFELDLAASRKQKANYPCYVRDRFTASRENGVAWKS